jgi:hypothetical protein
MFLTKGLFSMRLSVVSSAPPEMSFEKKSQTKTIFDFDGMNNSVGILEKQFWSI